MAVKGEGLGEIGGGRRAVGTLLQSPGQRQWCPGQRRQHAEVQDLLVHWACRYTTMLVGWRSAGPPPQRPTNTPPTAHRVPRAGGKMRPEGRREDETQRSGRWASLGSQLEAGMCISLNSGSGCESVPMRGREQSLCLSAPECPPLKTWKPDCRAELLSEQGPWLTAGEVVPTSHEA